MDGFLKFLQEKLGAEVEETQYGPEFPAPDSVKVLLAPFAQLIDEKEALKEQAQRLNNKMNYFRDEIIAAIKRDVPGAETADFRWDAHKGTVALEKAPEPAHAEWVREVIENGKSDKVTLN